MPAGDGPDLPGSLSVAGRMPEAADEVASPTADAGPGPMRSPRLHKGPPAAIALTPILSARYRENDLARIRAAAPGARLVSVSLEGLADGPLDEVEVMLRGPLPAATFDRWPRPEHEQPGPEHPPEPQSQSQSIEARSAC